MANYYKDEAGHFTNKENDGGPCHHKRINGGKYEFSEDGGKTWSPFKGRKEYDEYDGEESDFDLTTDEDIEGFDPEDEAENVINKMMDDGVDVNDRKAVMEYAAELGDEDYQKGLIDYMDSEGYFELEKPEEAHMDYEEIFTHNDTVQIERYAKHYDVDVKELKDAIHQNALDRIRQGDSVTNAKNDAMEEELDKLEPGSAPLNDEPAEGTTNSNEDDETVLGGRVEDKVDAILREDGQSDDFIKSLTKEQYDYLAKLFENMGRLKPNRKEGPRSMRDYEYETKNKE